MGLVIGMDEAGYGPNLGPLVIGVTCWEVPGDPRDFDFWTALESCVSESAASFPGKLQIADSKDVYSPDRGLGVLETAVLSMLASADSNPTDWDSLRTILDPDSIVDRSVEVWYEGFNPTLPLSADSDHIHQQCEALKQVYEQHGMRLIGIQCSVIEPRRFNDLLREHSSKGVVLSTESLKLLRRFWDPESTTPTLAISDKHGGRNRYDLLLSDVLDGKMVFRVEEGRQISRYRVGETELWFRMKAEQFLPVALASMAAKYVREITMDAANDFWTSHIAELKPTRGYPVDAQRFLRDIEEKVQELGIPLSVLWRMK